MAKVDCYFGVDTDKAWGINKYKLETYAKMADPSLELKKIAYSLPKKPDLLKRLANFFDLFTYSPLAVLKQRRKDSIAFILAHADAYLLNYFRFRKSVVLCYDILPLQFKLTGWVSGLKLKFAFRGMLKASRIIATSYAVKDDIVNYMGYPAERIDVIHGGVDPQKYKVLKEDLSGIRMKYGIPEGKRIVMFLSSEEPRKNFQVVLRAFARLKQRLPDVVLLKVGNAQKKGIRERNLRLCKHLHIERDVIFTDYVPEEDLPYIYNAADVFALPALYEGGISLPLIEAMACGCPVISTKYLAETTGDSPSMMKNATDVDELESLMYKVLTDKPFRLKVIRHGLEKSKEFHWEKTGKSVVGIIKRLASQPI